MGFIINNKLCEYQKNNNAVILLVLQMSVYHCQMTVYFIIMSRFVFFSLSTYFCLLFAIFTIYHVDFKSWD